MAQRLGPPPGHAALARIAPEIHTLPAGALLWRVYFRAASTPGRWDAFRSFGPTGARFDHQPPPPRAHARRAIAYAADSGPTCIAEVFQLTRVIDRFTDEPALAAFELTRDLPLLDLTGAWPTRAGGSMAIGSGSRAMARRWSRASYRAFPHVEGLRYGSSMNANRPAFALYERARSALPSAPRLDLELEAPGLRAPLALEAIRFGYGLI